MPAPARPRFSAGFSSASREGPADSGASADRLAGPGPAFLRSVERNLRRGDMIYVVGEESAALHTLLVRGSEGSKPYSDEAGVVVVIEPAMTIGIDRHAESTSRVPDVLLIKAGRAEGLVLDGAEEVLRTARPLVYVAIDPRTDSSSSAPRRDVIVTFMRDRGYIAEYLEEDEVERWAFWHPSGRRYCW